MGVALQQAGRWRRAAQVAQAAQAAQSPPRAAVRRLRLSSMTTGKPRELFIQGITADGRPFRPSDWAERLAGVMACFRPPGSRLRPGGHIAYSPYCVPRVINGVKCVIVNEAIQQVEPKAWEFVLNFARDNGLQVVDACLLPEDRDGP